MSLFSPKISFTYLPKSKVNLNYSVQPQITQRTYLIQNFINTRQISNFNSVNRYFTIEKQKLTHPTIFASSNSIIATFKITNSQNLFKNTTSRNFSTLPEAPKPNEEVKLVNDEAVKEIVDAPVQKQRLIHRLCFLLKKYFLQLIIFWLILFIILILISLEYNQTIKVVAIGSDRFIHSLYTGLQISFDYKYNLYNIPKDSEIYQEELKKAHSRSAERLLHLFKRNKGIFIKFGQHLSALDYLLPHEYTSIMRVLQDHAPTTTYEDIESVFLHEFRKTPDQIFDYFDKTPIAAASLAQVHIAIIDDQKVAVKVQFPGLKENCEGDSWTIATLLKLAENLFPDFKLRWLINEININLPLELDFFHEARNAEKLKKNFKNVKNVHVPEIVWPYSTSRILVMEFCEGVHIDDREGIKKYGITTKDVATSVTNTFNKMIFEDGFVHCDPHPGNLLVRPLELPDTYYSRFSNVISRILRRSTPPQIVVLDHGLYRNLNEDNFRIDYLHLWDALINFDEKKIEFYSKKLGAPGHQVFCSMLTLKPWERISEELVDTITEKEKEIIIKAAQSKIKDISDTLSAVKSELLLLFKTNDLLRLINKSLGNPINSFLVTSVFVKKLLVKMSIEKDPSLWNRSFAYFSTFIFNVKIQIVDLWLKFYAYRYQPKVLN